jgi:hypothetical protein
MSMDPIFKAVVAGRINMFFAEPELGRELSRWRLVASPPSMGSMELSRDMEHRYDRETVKSMTYEELKSVMVDLVRRAVVDGNAFHDAGADLPTIRT